MRTSRSRGFGRGGLISLLAAFIIAVPARASADENKVTVTIGKPGDRWLDAMQFLRVSRGQREKQFGYEITYLLPGLREHTLFWPHSKIDLDGSAPRKYRLQVMKLEQGRLFLPDRITSESLPDVYLAILSLEGSYLKAARGDLAAAKAFTDVVILESTRSGVGSGLASRTSATRPGAGAWVRSATVKPITAKPITANRRRQSRLRQSRLRPNQLQPNQPPQGRSSGLRMVASTSQRRRLHGNK